MNLRKVESANDIELSKAKASRIYIVAKLLNTQCPLVAPTSQMEPTRNTVPNIDPTVYFKLAFRMEPAVCDIDIEELPLRQSSNKDI